MEYILKNEFKISDKILEMSKKVEQEIRHIFDEFDEIKAHNQYKVIAAMQKNNLSDTHFAGSTGYGYGDRGREILDNIFADVFKAEDAIVRHQIVSGTHAISACLFGVLRPGDEMLSITGKPYDTLDEVIGIRGINTGSLKEYGIVYKQVDLLNNGQVDLQNVGNMINNKTRLIFIQKSRGYNFRSAIKVSEIKDIVEYIRNIKKDIVIMVDNCYGEFVEKQEPTQVDCDLIAGSLIKNPGGGIAPTGGYIAGKEEYVRQAAFRLTSPGIGKEVGATLHHNRLMFQGLFFAPHVVSESIKGAIYSAALMTKLGFETSPLPDEKRGDIIQAIKFGDKEKLISFCEGIQKGSPVDSYVVPKPWDMPGYDCQVIMAAGNFIQGSSIELSADAPIKHPYIAYLQGGLVYEHVKLGVMSSIQHMINKGLISL